MDALFDFGINLIESIQTWPSSLDGLMDLMTFMGTIEFYLLLIPFIYWAINPRLGFRILMLLIGTDLVGSFAKQLFHQPRPYWISETVVGRSLESSYGIPSTHASGSLAVWSALALHTKRLWFGVVAALIILLVALSRLYLGVHFPHDIVGGWLLGIVGLVVLVSFEKPIVAWFTQKDKSVQIGVAFALSASLALIGLFIPLLIASSPDPASWAAFAVEARSPGHFFTVSGALFGALAGYVLLQERLKFNHQVSWVLRIVRYVIGMVGTLAIWQGLDILFGLVATDESSLGLILRYVRYAFVTFWIIYGAPNFFQRWIGGGA